MRPCAPKFRRGGELAALALLGLAVAASRAAEPAAQPLAEHPLVEIRAAAIAAVGVADSQARASVDPALRLARCAQPLQAAASGPKTALVRCPDSPGWRLYVPVRAHREADVVVLTAPAAAGLPITASQLRTQRRDVDVAAAATFSDPSAVVGRVPGRTLAAGRAPTDADFSPGAMLRRGDPVVLVARSGGVEVRMQGRALGSARSGGRITVENIASHRVLRGRVGAEGVVEIVP